MSLPPPDFPVFVHALGQAIGADAVTTLPPAFQPHAALRVGGSWQVLVLNHIATRFTASLARGPGFRVESDDDAIAAVAALREALQLARPPPLTICDALVALLPLGGDAHPETAFPDSLAPAEARLIFGGHPLVVFQRRDGVRIAVEEVAGRPSRVARTAVELIEVAAWAVETQRPIIEAERAAYDAAMPPLPPLEDVVNALHAGVRLHFSGVGGRMTATFYARDGVVRCDLFDEGYIEDAPCRLEDLARWMSTAPDTVWRAVKRS